MSATQIFQNFLWLSMTLSISACSIGQKNSLQFEIKKNIPYKKIDNVSLVGDFYIPKSAGPKPAVIVVHGGGWKNRSGDMTAICKDLARAGYVAFNATYRLSPNKKYPAAAEDIRDAIQWLRTNAKNYEIDPNNIYGWGYSAGAHLILLEGLNPANKLKAIVAGGSPTDLTRWPNSPLVKEFIGSTLAESRKVWEEASPVNHVKPNSPPVFLYHGTWDVIVEIGQMYALRDELQKNKVPVETMTINYMGHFAVYFLSQKSVYAGIDYLNRQSKK